MAATADIELTYLSPALVESRQAQADALLSPALASGDELFERLGVPAKAHEWLRQMPWKRVVAAALVGDLLGETRHGRVLEVGGGLSGVTLELAKRQSYELVELATHEDEAAYRRVEDEVGRSFVTVGDWAEALGGEQFDVVIANDLFPNVDQRLDEFVDRFAPTGAELRLSLTYYEDTVFVVDRLGSGERLTIKPWGLAEIRRFVERLAGDGELTETLDEQLVYCSHQGGLFGNRRNVILMKARVGP